MNTEEGPRYRIPVWVWAATGVAFVLLLAGVLWTAGSVHETRIDANQVATALPDGQSMGAGPNTVTGTTPTIPPGYAGAPDDSKARVSIWETQPLGDAYSAPAPGSAQSDIAPVPPLPGQTPKAVARHGLRDMFPMGKIAPTTPAPRAKVYAWAPEVNESFPRFAYGGKDYAFTGKFITSGQADLAPTDTSVNGKQVYSLPGDDPTGPLFVPSQSDPGTYAVYRGNAG